MIGGMNAGDAGITSGGYALPDGTQIKIEAPEKAESASSADEGKDKKDPADEKDPKDEKGGKKDGKADGKAAKSGKGKEKPRWNRTQPPREARASMRQNGLGSLNFRARSSSVSS